LLAVDGGTVHLPCGSLSFFLTSEGDKGVPLAGVVDVSHSTELLKLALDVPVGHILVDPVHKEFAPLLRHYDGVWCNSLVEVNQAIKAWSF